MFCHSKFEVCTKNVSAQLGKLLICLSLLSFLSLNVICDKRFLSSCGKCFDNSKDNHS